MATVVNISSLDRKINSNSLNSNEHDNECTSLLITIPDETLCNSNEFEVSSILQESPMISCVLRFQKIYDSSLQGQIIFSEQSLSRQFVVSLYYLNSECKIALFETIYLTSDSQKSAHFQKTYQIWIRRGMFDIAEKFFNKNLYIYCKIVIKNISPAKLNVPETKKPTKLVSIYKEKLFTDFKIICKNKEFLVHKAILACSSPVFRKMLEIPMKESEENQVEIDGFESAVIELMIDYLYSEEIKKNLSQEILKQLFRIAHMYELESLKKSCLDDLCKSANDTSSIVDVISFAGSECKEEMTKFLDDIFQKLSLHK
ncbi:uncharacterized protein LOC122501446 [Leptopilina heterotoma]|uniref:uncharacterized protein LOC122501446 n=1 Tax=Leptopilina heterotoma TaxID=63436 RepID=UPI001CA88B5D|nr:uncharacterized protein LOC122501446 [Leptopilina heterotoma]